MKVSVYLTNNSNLRKLKENMSRLSQNVIIRTLPTEFINTNAEEFWTDSAKVFTRYKYIDRSKFIFIGKVDELSEELALAVRDTRNETEITAEMIDRVASSAAPFFAQSGEGESGGESEGETAEEAAKRDQDMLLNFISTSMSAAAKKIEAGEVAKEFAAPSEMQGQLAEGQTEGKTGEANAEKALELQQILNISDADLRIMGNVGGVQLQERVAQITLAEKEEIPVAAEVVMEVEVDPAIEQDLQKRMELGAVKSDSEVELADEIALDPALEPELNSDAEREEASREDKFLAGELPDEVKFEPLSEDRTIHMKNRPVPGWITPDSINYAKEIFTLADDLQDNKDSIAADTAARQRAREEEEAAARAKGDATSEAKSKDLVDLSGQLLGKRAEEPKAREEVAVTNEDDDDIALDSTIEAELNSPEDESAQAQGLTVIDSAVKKSLQDRGVLLSSPIHTREGVVDPSDEWDLPDNIIEDKALRERLQQNQNYYKQFSENIIQIEEQPSERNVIVALDKSKPEQAVEAPQLNVEVNKEFEAAAGSKFELPEEIQRQTVAGKEDASLAIPIQSDDSDFGDSLKDAELEQGASEQELQNESDRSQVLSSFHFTPISLGPEAATDEDEIAIEEVEELGSHSANSAVEFGSAQLQNITGATKSMSQVSQSGMKQPRVSTTRTGVGSGMAVREVRPLPQVSVVAMRGKPEKRSISTTEGSLMVSQVSELNRHNSQNVSFVPRVKDTSQIAQSRSVSSKNMRVNRTRIAGGACYIFGSTSRKSGASLIAYNYACERSREMHKKVVLIDLDFATSMLSRRIYDDNSLSMEDSCGIENVLQMSAADYLDRLDIFTARVTSSAGDEFSFIRGNQNYPFQVKELLSRINFGDMINALKAAYDIIILDVGTFKTLPKYKMDLLRTTYNLIAVFNCSSKKSILESYEVLDTLPRECGLILNNYVHTVNPIELARSTQKRVFGTMNTNRLITTAKELSVLSNVADDELVSNWKEIVANITAR